MADTDAVGVIVARFQVPQLHAGHRFLVTEVSEHHRDVLILLGVARSVPTDRNPLSYEMREAMVRTTFPDRHFTFAPLHGHPADYATRSKHIDEIVATLFPGRDAVLYGSRGSFRDKYSGAFRTAEIETIYLGSGTRVRNEITPIDSSDFRSGVIYSIVHFGPVARPAVDIAITRQGLSDVLLVRKNDEGGWRFPGGFFDPDCDDCYEDAAERVLRKELPGISVDPLHILGSKRMDDWRYRGTRMKIMTLFFRGTYRDGVERPGRGIDEAKWSPLADLHHLLVGDHQSLGAMLRAA